MSDHSRLHEYMIGSHLSRYLFAILFRGSMKILIPVSPFDRLHLRHPEMVTKGSDGMHRLFECQFDLETQTVEQNDFFSAQCEICGEENDSPPHRMVYQDEPHHRLGWFP